MYRYLILTLIVLFGATVLHAQGETAERPEREIYTVLAYGDDVFEPELWYASASEEAARTTATWFPRPESGFGSAVAFADYLHFDSGYSKEGLRELFDDAWFDVTLANYDSHTLTLECEQGDLRLFEFSLRFDDADYLMRYWVEAHTETRVMAMYIVFPARDVAARRTLEDYAQRLYPDFPACPR